MRIGEFAKRGNVSEKAVRHYDKIGLLKPSHILDNGYRDYSEDDLLKLQKIVLLKQLGFTLEEIYPMVSMSTDLYDSFKMQIELLQEHIEYLKAQKDTLEKISNQALAGRVDWSNVNRLMKLATKNSEVSRNYKNSKDLSVRILLHQKFSVGTIGWFDWLQSFLNLSGVNRLLEIGCGNGDLWKSFDTNSMRNREFFLTDKSPGMVSEVRAKLGDDFNCLTAECEAIPFKNSYFDTVVANHVFFYVNDLSKGLSEVVRVLKDTGVLYCTSYSQKHMREIGEICQAFDPRIKLSEDDLASNFGSENGKSILSKYFYSIETHKFCDALEVTNSKPLIDYILSCHGNQNELILPRLEEFTKYLDRKIEAENSIHITKDAVLFIARNPKR